MIAHIRQASFGEFPGLLRPLRCLADDHVVYVYKSWRREFSKANGTILFSLAHDNRSYSFGSICKCEVHIEERLSGLYVDGQRVLEEWPTPQQSVFRASRWTYRVKPEDDSIFFDFDTELP